MAFLAITNNPEWEYSNAPDTDDPVNGLTAIQVDHPGETESIYTKMGAKLVAGIRTDTIDTYVTETYVYCRQKNTVTDILQGYGEISKTYWDNV